MIDEVDLPAEYAAGTQTIYKFLGIPWSHDEKAKKTATFQSINKNKTS